MSIISFTERSATFKMRLLEDQEELQRDLDTKTKLSLSNAKENSKNLASCDVIEIENFLFLRADRKNCETQDFSNISEKNSGEINSPVSDLRKGLVLKIHQFRKIQEEKLLSAGLSEEILNKYIRESLEYASNCADAVLYGSAHVLTILNKYADFKRNLELKIASAIVENSDKKINN